MYSIVYIMCIRAVSAVQAIMASSAGVIIVTSCEDVMRDR